MNGEEVLYVFRKHPVVMRKGLIYGSFGLLVGPVYTTILTYIRPNSSPTVNFFFGSLLASLVLSAIIFMPSFISWYFSVYIVTNQRLIQIKQKGFFNKNVVDINLPQIQMVNYEINGLQETLLGFGTIHVQTYVGDLNIHDVHKPAHTQKKILNILREQGFLNQSNQPKPTDNNE